MSQPKLIFYDVLTRLDNISTSPNAWRVRLVLNYKRLEYDTIRLEGPDIASSHIAAGIPPTDTHADGTPRYTIPALIDLTNPDTPVRLSDSFKIIDYLERTYPEPDPQRALFPPGTQAFQKLAYHYSWTHLFFPHTFPLIMIKSMALQTDRTRVMFRTMYEKQGKSIEEMAPSEKEREEGWKKVRDSYELLGSFIEGNGNQESQTPFFMGSNICFFDLHVVAGLFVFRLVLGEEEFYREMGSVDRGRWVKLLDECADLLK